MCNYLRLILLVTFTTLVLNKCEALKLPFYLKQCKKNDPNLSKCLTESGNAGLSEFIKGDSTYHVPTLIPLHVSQMNIDVGGNLFINISDADIIGLDNLRLEKFDWDMNKKTVNAVLKGDLVQLIGTYDIAGRILILPINGHGPCNITFVNGVFDYHFNYELETRRNKEYIKIINNGMTYGIKRAYFKLDNLFNGDKRLGEEMSKFLDENWREVNGEIGARVGDALSEVFTSVIQSFFSRISFNNLFS